MSNLIWVNTIYCSSNLEQYAHDLHCLFKHGLTNIDDIGNIHTLMSIPIFMENKEKYYKTSTKLWLFAVC